LISSCGGCIKYAEEKQIARRNGKKKMNEEIKKLNSTSTLQGISSDKAVG